VCAPSPFLALIHPASHHEGEDHLYWAGIKMLSRAHTLEAQRGDTLK